MSTAGGAIVPTVEPRSVIHDPYWDEIIAPQQVEPEQRWNPSHFGEVRHKSDADGQLKIFYDDSEEPPDPDDYKNLSDYHQAWAQWKTLVGAQVTSSTIDTTVKPRVGAQVATNTKKKLRPNTIPTG